MTDEPNMIDINKKYKISDGRGVEIIAIRPELEYPVIGIVNNSGCITQWGANGTYDEKYDEYKLDLVEVKQYEKFNIDDPVLVRQAGGSWLKAHFAGIADNGRPTTFIKGRTSFTNKHDIVTQWFTCVKYEDRTPDMEIRND